MNDPHHEPCSICGDESGKCPGHRPRAGRPSQLWVLIRFDARGNRHYTLDTPSRERLRYVFPKVDGEFVLPPGQTEDAIWILSQLCQVEKDRLLDVLASTKVVFHICQIESSPEEAKAPDGPTGPTMEERVANWKRMCAHCGKPTPYPMNYCNWECQVAHWRATGGKEHLPNGLPIQCLTAGGGMLECEHGDHITYIFPVEVKYIGPPIPEEDYSQDETHALIYTDGSIALTLHECEYFLWYLLHEGEELVRFNRTWREGKYRLSEESLKKIQEYLKVKYGEEWLKARFGE